MKMEFAARQFLLMAQIEGKDKFQLLRYQQALSLFVQFVGPDFNACDVKPCMIREFALSEYSAGRPARHYYPSLRLFLRWVSMQNIPAKKAAKKNQTASMQKGYAYEFISIKDSP
jgi:hypothetical protein